MLSEFKQLEIIESQLDKALNIVLAQRARYERLNSALYQCDWKCADADPHNEIANGIQGAIGSLMCALENIYNN